MLDEINRKDLDGNIPEMLKFIKNLCLKKGESRIITYCGDTSAIIYCSDSKYSISYNPVEIIITTYGRYITIAVDKKINCEELSQKLQAFLNQQHKAIITSAEDLAEQSWMQRQ